MHFANWGNCPTGSVDVNNRFYKLTRYQLAFCPSCHSEGLLGNFFNNMTAVAPRNIYDIIVRLIRSNIFLSR